MTKSTSLEAQLESDLLMFGSSCVRINPETGERERINPISIYIDPSKPGSDKTIEAEVTYRGGKLIINKIVEKNHE